MSNVPDSIASRIPAAQVAMGQPAPAPTPTAVSLFPSGVGITNRPDPNEKECRCSGCTCMCCTHPVYYSDSRRRQMSEMVEWKFWCDTFTVDNVSILGANPLSFRKGASSAWCPDTHRIDVAERGRKVGHVAMYTKPFEGNPTIMGEAFDAKGGFKFAYIDTPLYPRNHFSGDSCGWGEYNWPVVSRSSTSATPVTHITFRRHCCSAYGCYPAWLGIRQMPRGASAEDQKLLLAMIHARQWRRNTRDT